MQEQEPFVRCPNCNKYVLPPGLIIVVHSKHAMEQFCDTRGACGRIECPGCGFYVNPLYHSQWECNFAKSAYEQRDVPLDKTEVLSQAEAILKEGRRR